MKYDNPFATNRMMLAFLVSTVAISLSGVMASSPIAATAVAAAEQPAAKSPDGAPLGRIVTSLGKREVILESGRYGLKYFPDECLAFVQTTPKIRLLMAAGKSTFLLEGRDMKSLVLRGEVLKPGRPGSFDNGYAGIGGVVRDPRTGQLLAFYHAEDHEGMRPIPGGIPGFYCCVALAVSTDNGTTFRKLGPIIKSSLPKDVKGRSDQGCGDMCVVGTADHRFVYVYYCDHSRIDNRGVQICMARCPIEDAGRTDRWRKYYQGAFDRAGLGWQRHAGHVGPGDGCRCDFSAGHLRARTAPLHHGFQHHRIPGTRPRNAGPAKRDLHRPFAGRHPLVESDTIDSHSLGSSRSWHGGRVASGVASFGRRRRFCQGVALLFLQRALGAQASAEATSSRRPANHLLDW